MRVKRPPLPRAEGAYAGELEDLRQATVADLAIAMLVLAWLTALRGLWTRQVATLAVPLLLTAGSAAAMRPRQLNSRVARYLVILSLIAATAAECWLFPTGPARYYWPAVLVACSLLVPHASVFLVATLAALAYLATLYLRGANPAARGTALDPLYVMYLTAFAAWLSSRQLHVALAWMQSSYSRARDMLVELRERRAALARTVKALEEATGRIENMNCALIEARSAAEEARRLKAEFAANISHELRTPLSLIIGFSETMANAPETYGDMAWPPSLRGDVEQIYRSSCHLSSLVDDILDLSALDVHRMGLVAEEVSLGDVLAEAASVVAELFRAKGLYLRLELAPDLPRLRIDPTRIRQVLLNLLNNASRFTTAGGVTITACRADREVQVAVADTGVGIAPRDVPKVFEEFGQVDGSTRRRHGGTGLGVPLSKRLVELHGGRLWMESTLGEGTTFYFTLPATGPAEGRDPGPGSRPAPAVAAPRKPLLVAEPDPLLLRMLRRHVQGYEIAEVTSPEEVPFLAERLQPSALLVDSEGDEAFAALQAWSKVAPGGLPVIAFGMRGALSYARALGARDYLVKPLVRQQLLAALARLGDEVHKVLVADDDPQFVELVSRTLQSAGKGYQPIKVFDGAEALARLRRQRPDAVLLDLGMPQVDGLAVLAAMRADAALAAIPVIVVSAREYPEGAVLSGGQALGLSRREGLTGAELLNCLQVLLGALPPRAPAAAGPHPGPPADPGAPPAS